MVKAQDLIDAAARDRALYQELAATGAFDKPEYNERMKACHEENADLLEAFLANYGWPLPEEYGKEAHEAAWLIAIHAIARPPLIKKTAHFLEEAWQSGKLPAHYFANFYDRIALYEGRKQRYGTHLFPSKEGWKVCDLENPETVNERRAAMGMQSLEEWLQEAGDDGSGYSNIDQANYDAEFTAWCYETGWRQQ